MTGIIARYPGGAVGKRIQIVICYLCGVAAALLAFKAVPNGCAGAQAAIVFMIGFSLVRSTDAHRSVRCRNSWSALSWCK